MPSIQEEKRIMFRNESKVRKPAAAEKPELDRAHRKRQRPQASALDPGQPMDEYGQAAVKNSSFSVRHY
jgi:hypothetical protein